MAAQGFFVQYLDVLRYQGSWRFCLTALYARLPISMIGLSIVLGITTDQESASFALAGALAASYAVAAALIAPFGSRWADRRGQARVVPVLAAISASSLVLLTAAIASSKPTASLFILAVIAGGSAPNIGSLVRTRWVARVGGTRRLRTAFALEAVLDEVVFILGPPLATLLALQVAPFAPLLLAAAILLTGSGLLAAQRGSDPGAIPRQAGTGRHALLLPGMWQLTLLMALLGAVFGSFEVTTVAFARSLGSEGATGVLLALYAFGSMLGGLGYGAIRISRPLGSQLVVVGVFLALVSAPLPLVGSIPTMAALATLAGAAVAPLLIITVAQVERMVANARMTEALTVIHSGIAVGLAIAAPASGVLIDTYGASSGYWVLTASAVVAMLLAFTSRPRLVSLEKPVSAAA